MADELPDSGAWKDWDNMKDPAEDPGKDPAEVLTPEEIKAATAEARLMMASPEELRWMRLTDNERQQQLAIAELERQLEFYRECPELVSYTSPYLGAPAFVDYDVPDRSDFEDYAGFDAERSRRKIRAQAKAMRAVGLTVEKEYGEESLTIKARVPEYDLLISATAYGYCVMVEGPPERVEVVEVPEEIQKAHTKVVMQPKQTRLCAPLMTERELEDV